MEKQQELKKFEEQEKQLHISLDEIMSLPTMHGNFSALLNVDYQPPTSNFDRSQVLGRVVRLMTVKEDRYSIALEQAAGEKLFAIIVENDVICSVLIKNNCFMKNRAILIPNNKCGYEESPADVIEYVNTVTKGKAKHALSLIQFNAFYERSMKSIFGDVFVCEDVETAKKISFDPRVNAKCVTLDGTVYEPSGVITGGNEIRKELSILNRIQAI